MPNISITQQLITTINSAVKVLGLSAQDIHLEHPANPEHGDYSSNVAMVLFGKMKSDPEFLQQYKNPRDLAQKIVVTLESSLTTYNLQPITFSIAGPGFINFKLSNEFFIKSLEDIVISKGDVVRQSLVPKKVMTEFTDPNPFKEFHIGHLYSNSVGESISRIIEATGDTVHRVCYQGDVGMHVAKSLWGIQQLLLQRQMSIEDFEKHSGTQENTQSIRAKFLGEAYAYGAQHFEESDKVKEEIKALNKMIFAKDTSILPLYNIGKKWSLDYFETIYRRLGTHFEDYFFESEVADKGVQIVQKYLQKGLFEQSDGAVIFPGSRYGLHDRVFINSLGLPTYEAKELGLAPTKYDRWPYDQSIIITGNEIKEYFKVLLKAISLINPELATKTVHLTHGMVRLPEGKMSSRKGNVLTGEWLLDTAKKMIREILEKNKAELSETEKETISEKVSVAAVKYALLKSNLGSDISFNFDESINFEGNSGPYIQYTYARCKSVLRKGQNVEKYVETQHVFHPLRAAVLQPSELSVLRLLSKFDEVVHHAANEFAPHHICTYLFELSSAYNGFYNSLSILNASDEQQKKLRLSITQATSVILQKGLWLLGIDTVEQM